MTAGVAGAAGIRPDVRPMQADQERDTADVLRQILAELRGQHTVCTTAGCPTIQRLRDTMRVFIKSNNHYPDYVDVGLDIWDDAYDWHLRNRQAVTVSRLPEGRYGMAFMFSTLVLRHEMTPNYIGPGYDK
jgi:hypothetical protein